MSSLLLWAPTTCCCVTASQVNVPRSNFFFSTSKSNQFARHSTLTQTGRCQCWPWRRTAPRCHCPWWRCPGWRQTCQRRRCPGAEEREKICKAIRKKNKKPIKSSTPVLTAMKRDEGPADLHIPSHTSSCPGCVQGESSDSQRRCQCRDFKITDKNNQGKNSTNIPDIDKHAYRYF